MATYKGRRFSFASLGVLAIISFISSASVSQVCAQTTSTMWSGTTLPARADDGPDTAVEVGVKFRSDVSGSITAIRFYKASTNTGTHVASLWSSTGTLLAQATASGETASGWQQVNLSTPVSITANTVYVASYHTSVGHYSDDVSYFAGKGMDSPPLHALADGVSGVNGVYAYNSSSKFPNLGWNQSNYWVDALFSTTAPPPTTDTTPPTVSAFSIPSTASSLSVPITTLTATDNVAVTGYLLTESSSSPVPTATGWTAIAPGSYTFASAGSKTLYAWARDAAGNVSASKSANVTVTITTTSTGPEPTGWYAGDMHVHRSCGSSPEAVSSIFSKMSTNNLSVASLLADMGNGEVQNATTDLPLVNGQDASVSTPGRILHWDTEWHWDATYSQYAHQALGGHIVALGLSSARQIWDESTFPIIDWAHQQGGIAGFAHMQYLDDGLPQSLTCCTPIEYPVEVALGSADFISEDVDDVGNQGTGMHPEAALHAYYRLLNDGFRPGLAAGTDYPCNGGRALGSLLTYAQPTGGMTYRNWINSIKAGRTVVSRNGHKEFLNLVVNGTATPGDEIKLASAGNVSVTVQWTATQSMSGTIELLRNGVVVASQQGSVASGSPLTLSTSVSFPASGWLAARRMNSSNEHQVHTSAVFVTVNGAPVRANASDAQFYVDWMNTLLTNTSRGGIWNSYFPTELTQAQARYQAAKTIYQQIATEASGGSSTGPSIFTTQVPTMYENEAPYELGTKFYADVSGQLTGVRIYTNALEGGAHTVRIWQVSNKAVVAGPYTWNISSGTEGWKTFNLPAPLGISANTDYIVDVSNSNDHYYAEEPSGFSAAIVSGHLHTYVGSGAFSGTLGTMPTSVWQNTNYFRDVVFAPQN